MLQYNLEGKGPSCIMKMSTYSILNVKNSLEDHASRPPSVGMSAYM